MATQSGEHRPVNPKVTAASAGAGVGVLAGEVVHYFLEQVTRQNFPDSIDLGIVVLVAAGLSFASGWLKSGPA